MAYMNEFYAIAEVALAPHIFGHLKNFWVQRYAYKPIDG